jgi:hypothetical protein
LALAAGLALGDLPAGAAPGATAPVEAAAPSAAKRSKPRITYLRNSAQSTAGVSFSVVKPQLKGSTSINRLALMYRVESALTDAIRHQAKYAKTCSKRPALKLRGTSKGAVYAGRYASVGLVFTGNGCKGSTWRRVKTFTLDLKRGAFVKMRQMVPLRGKALQLELIEKLYKTPAYRRGALGGKRVTLVTRDQARSKARKQAPLPPIEGWRVTKAGAVFYFLAADAKVVQVSLRWRKLR